MLRQLEARVGCHELLSVVAGLFDDGAISAEIGNPKRRQAVLRVPNRSPGPRSSKSISASAKPSVDATNAFSRSTTIRRSADRQRRSRSRETCREQMRPRSWCNWASPKRWPSAMVISVAFGTSTPTSTTEVADEHLSLARAETVHDSVLFAGRHPPVDQPEPKVCEFAIGERIRRSRPAGRRDGLRFVHTAE